MNNWIYNDEKKRHYMSNERSEFLIFFDEKFDPCWTLVFSINGNHVTVRNYGVEMFAVKELKDFVLWLN